jgi:hypothetical protein
VSEPLPALYELLERAAALLEERAQARPTLRLNGTLQHKGPARCKLCDQGTISHGGVRYCLACYLKL